MSKTLLFETKSVLKELKTLRKALEKSGYRASHKNDTFLVETKRKGTARSYYYLKKKGNRKRKYLGNSSNKTVNSIKTTKYVNKLFEILDNDIHLLELLDSEFILPEQQVVNALLPKVYQNPNMPSFFQSGPDAVEWKKLKEAEKAKIPPYRPEDLTHTASDGTKMRSLSEVIIANYLLSLGITFVYELPLTHHGKRIFPDFTILSPIDNKTEIIIEHQGAMDSEQYQGKFIRTVLFYLETGLVPNKDVFFTFNHLNRNLDLRQIDSILHIAFGYGT